MSVILLLLVMPLAHATPLILDQHQNGQTAEGHLSFLLDPSGHLEFATIEQSKFQPLEGDARLGFTDATLWLKLSLQQTTARPQQWLLEVVFASLDQVQLYTQHPDGTWQIQTAGDTFVFAQRPVDYRNFVFPIQLADNQPQTLYVRITTQDSLVAPVRIWSPKQFQKWQLSENLLLGLSYGVMLGMLIYNAMLWLILKDRLYGVYLMAAVAAILTVSELNGSAFQYLWPNNLWLANYQHVLVPSLYFLTLTAWARIFLDTAKRVPKLDIALKSVIALSIAMWPIAIAGFYRLGNQMAFLVGLYMVVVFSSASIRVALTGFAPARLFVLAQVFPLIGALLTVSRASGLLPNSLITEHGFQLGVTLEVLLFSLALAQRVKQLKQAKIDAQHQAETDHLTGVYNRAGLFRHSEALLCQTNHPLSILLIDLDHFKPINDQMGHAAGDLVLTTIAERIQSQIRPATDIVGRIGGDEFVVVLKNTDQTQATLIAERIVNALNQPITTAEGIAQTSASIGVACSLGESTTLDKLLQQADKLMYQAKKEGRNAWCAFPL